MPIDPSNVAWDEKPAGQPMPEDIVWDEEPPKKKRTLGQDVKRALGLTGRHVIQGSLGLADLLASPIRLAGNAIRPGTFTATGGEEIANRLGLPEPENQTERVVGMVGQGMAGAGGTAKVAEALTSKALPVAQQSLKWLAAKPSVQVTAGAGSGAGQAVARENDMGPYGELALALAGGIAAPAAARSTRLAAEPLIDSAATVGALLGNKRGTERLLTDAIERAVGGSKDKVTAALMNARETVPGVKPTVAEAIVKAQQGKPEQFGGRIVRWQKDLTGAEGVEDVLPTNTKQQQAAVEAEISRVNADTAPMREAALQSANAGGVKSGSIVAKIDAVLSTPGIRASKVAQAALNDIKDTIQKHSKGSLIEANDLYTIRKEIGNVIGKHSKESQSWDKRLSSGLERDVQLAIDDAIEAAGGTGWKSYLKTYSDRMQAVREHELLQGDVKRVAAQVKGGAGASVVSGEIPKPPTLLSRPMMLLNYGLKMIGQNANDPVVKELTNRLKDPKAFAELMMRPATDPLKMRAMEVIKRATVATALTQQQAK